MSIKLINSWTGLRINNGSGIDYGQKLSDFSGNSSVKSLDAISVLTTISDSNTVNEYASGVAVSSSYATVGIYKNNSDVYTFVSSTGAGTPGTLSGGWTLVAQGTGMTEVSIGYGATDKGPTVLNSLNLTLANSGVPIAFNGASILTLTGSSGNDSVIFEGVNGTGSTMVANFAQGGTDNIYFTSAKSSVTFNNLDIAASSAGTLSLVGSADGSTAKATVVLGSGLTTLAYVEGASGGAGLTVGTDGKLNLTSVSGAGITLRGLTTTSTINTLTIGEVAGNITASGIGTLLDIGTISSGTNAFSFSGTESENKVKLGLVSGGKTSLVAAGQASIVTVDSLTGGEVIIAAKSVVDNLSAAITEKGKLSLGDLALTAGTKLANATFNVNANTIGGSAAQTIVGSVAATKEFGFEGTGSDKITITSLGDSSAVSVKGGADTLSINSFGAAAKAILIAESGDADGYLTLGSGSSFGSITTNSGSMVTANDAAVLVATVTGASTVNGSTGDDQFTLNLSNTDAAVSLSGGAGNDSYKFASISGGSMGAIITDFGWADASGNAADSTKGADILLVNDTTSATLAKIVYDGKTIYFGDNAVTGTASGDVYAKIGVNVADAKLYKLGASGASLFDSETPQTVTPQTRSDGTYYDASNTAHAYINAASGTSTVDGFATYDGTNDNVASILNGNNVTVDNAVLSTGAKGVVLSDAEGENTIALNDVNPGKIIKMGTSMSDTQAVYLASSGTNTMTADQLDVLKNNDGVILGQGTGTKIDLGATKAGTVNGDDAMYKNVGGILGSTVGGSLLNAGSGSVNLVSQADGDTMDGGTGSVANVLTASGNKTTFALHEGIGKDTISGFGFGPDTTTADVVDFGSGIALSTDNVTLGSGKLLLGSGSDSYEIKAASGVDQAVVRYSGGGSNGGAILADLSSGGSADLDYVNGVNIVMGRGEKTTLTVGAGDTVAAERANEPSGIGWNSMILTDDVGTIDGTNSSMTAFNGEGGYANVVKASTVVGADKAVWICGGLEDGFADSANDTLVATGKGNNQIFVGAKMGNDVLQGVSSGDTITFIDTKISDYVNDITDLISVSGTGFSVDFAGAGTVNGGTGTAVITGTLTTSADKVTNLVFHFDSDGTGAANDYRWDGQSLVAITSTATA